MIVRKELQAIREAFLKTSLQHVELGEPIQSAFRRDACIATELRICTQKVLLIEQVPIQTRPRQQASEGVGYWSGQQRNPGRIPRWASA